EDQGARVALGEAGDDFGSRDRNRHGVFERGGGAGLAGGPHALDQQLPARFERRGGRAGGRIFFRGARAERRALGGKGAGAPARRRGLALLWRGGLGSVARQGFDLRNQLRQAARRRQ